MFWSTLVLSSWLAFIETSETSTHLISSGSFFYPETSEQTSGKSSSANRLQEFSISECLVTCNKDPHCSFVSASDTKPCEIFDSLTPADAVQSTEPFEITWRRIQGKVCF